MDKHDRSDLFSQIEYLLIRLLLIALLLLGAYELLKQEIYGSSANTEVHAAVVAHSQLKIAGDRDARIGEKSNEET